MSSKFSYNSTPQPTPKFCKKAPPVVPPPEIPASFDLWLEWWNVIAPERAEPFNIRLTLARWGETNEYRGGDTINGGSVAVKYWLTPELTPAAIEIWYYTTWPMTVHATDSEIPVLTEPNYSMAEARSIEEPGQSGFNFFVLG
jgi:hypothetical protein